MCNAGSSERGGGALRCASEIPHPSRVTKGRNEFGRSCREEEDGITWEEENARARGRSAESSVNESFFLILKKRAFDFVLQRKPSQRKEKTVVLYFFCVGGQKFHQVENGGCAHQEVKAAAILSDRIAAM